MKIKIAAVAVMFIIMALLPFTAARFDISKPTKKEAAASTADTPSAVSSDTESKDETENRLSALTAAQCRADYNDEAIKAIALIINTNLSVKPESFTDNDCLYKENADEEIQDMYDRIEAQVNSVKEKTLCIDNKALYIPFCTASNGSTCKSEEYDYLQAVASPWDCYLDDYDEQNQCIGVSIGGMSYLCSRGASAEEALKWYLPDLSITDN